MIIVAAIILCLYLLLVTTLYRGWRKAIANKKQLNTQPERFISIIIPVRNEVKNIASLLQDLNKQNYSQYEVIIIDDHSEDNTVETISALNYPFVRCVNNHGEGKKHAITAGIDMARGEIIVTTDGDCKVSPFWLSAINNHFANESIVMVIGGVKLIEDDNFFYKLQQIEFSSLIGTAASTLSLGSPTMCNGANLAYRKKIFLEVNGYKGNMQVASGDDEFLMRKVHALFPMGIVFLSDIHGVVTTGPQINLKSFIHQRVRWAGKWRHNSSIGAVLLALFIVIVQVATLYCFFELFSSISFLILTVIIAKCIFEAFLLLNFTRFLKIKWSWLAFLILQLIYPLYVVIVTLMALRGGYTWKERKFKS